MDKKYLFPVLPRRSGGGGGGGGDDAWRWPAGDSEGLFGSSLKLPHQNFGVTNSRA
jgi:hypothetical protein